MVKYPAMNQIIKSIALQFSIDWRLIAAFIEVESGGKGFTDKGRILIQFEPSWFRKKVAYAPSGQWSVNKVDIQKKEWTAFNNAYSINPHGALESTSIGLGQIMGFHWKRLGYSTVGQMWDDAKNGVDRQIWQICKFIETDNNLHSALITKDWHKVAVLYNGASYRELAKKNGREPYDVSLEKAYKKYEKLS